MMIRSNKSRSFIPLLLLMIGLQQATAQQVSIPLYEGQVPNARKAPADYFEQTDVDEYVTRVTQPALIPFFPKKETATGTAILIFPGGGYRLLSLAECVEIAKALSQEGIAAFVVKYRLPNDTIMVDKSIGPLQDAQAAIKLVRKRAAEWGIKPDKIGMMGLSAGGHLVSMEGTQSNRVVIDNKEKLNLQPDFMALLYPVIIYDPAIPQTRERLIGKAPSPELLQLYSTDKHVTAATPPTFMVHAVDDKVIPIKNTLSFFAALQQNNVPSEIHLLQSGGHGFALTDLRSKDNWFRMFKSWLTENGF